MLAPQSGLEGLQAAPDGFPAPSVLSVMFSRLYELCGTGRELRWLQLWCVRALVVAGAQTGSCRHPRESGKGAKWLKARLTAAPRHGNTTAAGAKARFRFLQLTARVSAFCLANLRDTGKGLENW